MGYTDKHGRPEIVAAADLKTGGAVPRVVAAPAAGNDAAAEEAGTGGQPAAAPARLTGARV